MGKRDKPQVGYNANRDIFTAYTKEIVHFVNFILRLHFFRGGGTHRDAVSATHVAVVVIKHPVCKYLQRSQDFTYICLSAESS